MLGLYMKRKQHIANTLSVQEDSFHLPGIYSPPNTYNICLAFSYNFIPLLALDYLCLLWYDE